MAPARQRLRALDIEASAISADLADLPGIPKMVASVLAEVGMIDILVNAVGVNLRQPYQEVSPETWSTQPALHVGAPFFFTQTLAPAMAERALWRSQRRRVAAEPRHCPGMVGQGRHLPRFWARIFLTTQAEKVMNAPILSARKAVQTCIASTGHLEGLHGATVFLPATPARTLPVKP